MSKVLTVGTFDLYHAGHTNLIFQCAKIAGIFDLQTKRHDEWHNVTIGLNSDKFVEEYKGKKPLYTYDERYKLLVNNRYVYNIKENNEKSLQHLLIDSKYNSAYDFLVIGSDWATKDYYAQIGVDQKWLDENGIILVYVPYARGISTTKLRERIIRDG